MDIFKAELTEQLQSGVQDASDASQERDDRINEMIASLERAVGEADSKATAAQAAATEVRESTWWEGSVGDVGMVVEDRCSDSSLKGLLALRRLLSMPQRSRSGSSSAVRS